MVAEPEGYDATKTYPIMLALPVTLNFPGTKPQPVNLLGMFEGGVKEAVRQGWVVVSPVTGNDDTLVHLVRHLRRTYRVEFQRLFVAGLTRATAFARARRSDIARVLLAGPSLDARSSSYFSDPYDNPDLAVVDCEDFAKGIIAARTACTPKNAIERAISATIDDFHDCAAKADGERYFGHFAPNGVFLGTDGTERWTRQEFRAWGWKHFERESAWILVPQNRNIDIAGDFAWFDESLHSDSYGECRGTGALQMIDGVWKITQYSLSVPIPNSVMTDAVAMIAAAKTQTEATGATTVFVVRHAEKQKEGNDPELSTAGVARAARLAMHLASIDLIAGYATANRCTQATLAPSCKAKGIEVQVLKPRVDIGAKILKEHRGGTVLVGGHANTVPAILTSLGVQTKITISEGEFSNLFIVTIEPSGEVRLLHLKY